MGYRSDFTLTVEASLLPIDPATFQKNLEDTTGYSWDAVETEFYLNNAKWYEQEAELEKFAQLYPDVRISVHARGEDGAEWIYDVFAGKTHRRDCARVWEERTLWS